MQSLQATSTLKCCKIDKTHDSNYWICPECEESRKYNKRLADLDFAKDDSSNGRKDCRFSQNAK